MENIMDKSIEEQIQELQEKLNALNKEREIIQSEKNSVFKDLEKKYSEVEKNLLKLQENKQQTREIERQMNQLKLSKLKENLNFDNIKKTVTSSSIFQKIKSLPEKINTQALDAQYQKYKNLCIQKGEEIKSKEEFSKLMQDIKSTNFQSLFQKAKSEVQSLSKNAQEIFTEILKDYESSLDGEKKSEKNVEETQDSVEKETKSTSKVAKKPAAKKAVAKATTRKVVNASKTESVQKAVSVPKLTTKMEGLQDWIQAQKIKPSILKQDRKTVYEMYSSYMTNKYPNSNLVFSYTNGTFSKNLDLAISQTTKVSKVKAKKM